MKGLRKHVRDVMTCLCDGSASRGQGKRTLGEKAPKSFTPGSAAIEAAEIRPVSLSKRETAFTRGGGESLERAFRMRGRDHQATTDSDFLHRRRRPVIGAKPSRRLTKITAQCCCSGRKRLRKTGQGNRRPLQRKRSFQSGQPARVEETGA